MIFRTRFRRQGLRLRITVTVVGTAVILALVIAVATFYTVGSFLDGQRTRSATRQSTFTLLFAQEFLEARPADVEGLVERLQARGGYQAIATEGENWFSTTLALTPTDIPEELRAIATSERLTYQRVRGERVRSVVFGAPLPLPEGELYLFYSLDDVDQTLSLLARVLAGSGFAVVVVALLVSQAIARRLIRPLGEVSAAAERIAEGLLETRVSPATPDEVGLLAASFNEMAQALQEMIARERRFVSNVSHELRTPLAALRTASELLAGRRENLPPEVREAADLVAEDVANLQHLVEELMEVSAVDSGRAAVRLEPVDMRALAEALVRSRRRDAAVEGGGVVTLSDKARLERILVNLLDNAYDHGEGRGVRVEIASNGASCVVRVSDRGPGIIAGDLPHLFDRFYKADRSRTRERGGIGLGLAIAAENARLLGGSLEAASEPDGETSFTLTLPHRRTEDARELLTGAEGRAG